MSTRHTPGPWVIQWGHQGTRPLNIHNNDVNIVTGMGRKAHPEAVQNARLIAAAPDLLDALQSIVDDYEFCKSGAYGDRSAIYAATARDAIAKTARGKA